MALCWVMSCVEERERERKKREKERGGERARALLSFVLPQALFFVLIVSKEAYDSAKRRLY